MGAVFVCACFTNQLSKVLHITFSSAPQADAMQWKAEGTTWKPVDAFERGKTKLTIFINFAIFWLEHHHKSFVVEIKKGNNCHSEGEGTDGAKFIDDCSNIGRGPENFIAG